VAERATRRREQRSSRWRGPQGLQGLRDNEVEEAGAEEEDENEQEVTEV